jgi:hypothetical protein
MVAIDRPDARSSLPDALRYFDHNVLLKYRIGTKSGSLERRQKMMSIDHPEGHYKRPNRTIYLSGRPWLPSGRACFRLHFGRIFGFPKPINKRLEACFQHKIWW